MSRILRDRSKIYEFEKVGRMYLSGTRKSLKIIIEDDHSVFPQEYFVGVGDIQKVLRSPKATATIVKIKNNSEI